MKKHTKYLFLVIPLVMLTAMLFPSTAYAQDGGTSPDVPTTPTIPGTPTSTVSDTTNSSSPSTECTSPGVYGDPWFKVGVVTYYFLLNGSSCPSGSTSGVNCFISLPGVSPINDALNWINSLTGALPTDKKVYVEAGTYAGAVLVDGSGTNKVANLVGLIGHGSSDTTITGGIDIGFTKTGFTLSGFNFSGAPGIPLVYIHNNIGALTLSDLMVQNSSGDGISVNTHQGSIALSGIMSSGNTGNGASLGNNGYLTAYPVTITNSEFDNNNAASSIRGLSIDSKGAVSLNGVSASANDGGGLLINAGSISIKNSYFSNNTYTIAGADGWGARLFAGNLGAVSLDNVFANSNQEKGIGIETTGGAVTISNLEASSNFYGGLLIGSYSTLAGAVKVSNAEVNYNSSYSGATNGIGVKIYSKSNVTIDTLDAFQTNYGSNLWIDNCNWTGAKCLGTGSVVISSKKGSSFSNNGYGAGINIVSAGAVSLSDFSVYNSAAEGVRIDNTYGPSTAGVTIGSTLPGSWQNASTNNSSSNGVVIFSNGTVSVDRLQSNYNGLGGLVIGNQLSTSSPGVTVKNSSFYGNSGGSGLEVTSKGAISISNTYAAGNSDYGLLLSNTIGNAPVSILSPFSYNNNSGYNGNNAILVTSKGAITVKGVYIYNNPLTGIVLDNSYGTSAGVTMADINISQITNPSQDGISVNSHGAISLSNVGAFDTTGNGITLNNQGASIPALVNVVNTNAESNTGLGISITSKGAVTLTSIGARGNGNSGVKVDNFTGTGGVTVNGSINNFNSNAGRGLEINSKGNVLLSNIYADSNDLEGLLVNELFTGAAGNVTITSTLGTRNTITSNGFVDDTHQNNYSGLSVNAQGNIVVERTDAGWNAGFGMYLNNFGAATAKNVTVKDSLGWNNQYSGISINAKGTVTLQNARGNDNTQYLSKISMNTGIENLLNRTQDKFYFQDATGGSININVHSDVTSFCPVAELYKLDGTLIASDLNAGCIADANITTTINNTDVYYISVSSGHSYYGMYVVSLYNTPLPPSPYSGMSNGVEVYSTSSVTGLSTTGGTGNRGDDNAGYGVYVYTTGTVSIAAAGGDGNGISGVAIYNYTGSSTPVTITGGSAQNNRSSNYAIYSTGAVSISGVTGSTSSTSAGIYINNSFSTTHQPVTVTNVTTEYNYEEPGLSVSSNGNITLNGITSDNNLSGAALNNSFYSLGKITVIGTAKPNTFYGNFDGGLYVYAGGAASIDKVIAYQNTGDGIYASVGTALTLTNLKLYYNTNNGVEAVANGLVTVNNVQSIDNGSSIYNGDGIKLTLSSDPVTIANSLFIGNHGAGIEVISGSTYSLVSTSFFGNNTNGTPSIFNFWWH